MKDIAEKHQIKIARDSFNKNSCLGARILGMTHREAYEILKAKTKDNPSPCPECMIESGLNALVQALEKLKSHIEED